MRTWTKHFSNGLWEKASDLAKKLGIDNLKHQMDGLTDVRHGIMSPQT